MIKPKWLSEGREFVREKVRERDKYKCKSCKKKWRRPKRRFDVHHLNGMCGRKSRKYDRLDSIKGLITLCHSCHMKKHASKRGFGVNHGLKFRVREFKRLRRQGLSYDKIGKLNGVSSAAIYWVVNPNSKGTIYLFTLRTRAALLNSHI